MEHLASLPPDPEVTGAWRGDQQVHEALVDHYYRQAEAKPFAGEIPHSPERVLQLEGLGSAFLELGKDLGVDLRGRLPEPGDYHFFQNKADLDAAIRSTGTEANEAYAGATLPDGIFIVDRGNDTVGNICHAAHETVHYLARKKIGTGGKETEDGVKDVRVKTLRQGYRHRNEVTARETFQGLDEIATEFMYLHVLNGGYWDRQPNLPKRGDRNPTFYTSLDIIGDELVQAAAKAIGSDPLTVLNGLERDVLTGKSEGLRTITSYIRSSADTKAAGTEAVRKLVHAPDADPEGRFKQLAQDLGLPDAVARIEEAERGESTEPTKVLRWVGERGNSEVVVTTVDAVKLAGSASPAGPNHGASAAPQGAAPGPATAQETAGTVPGNSGKVTFTGPVVGGRVYH